MATLTSKREVRDHVKATLQPLVDDGTIESEELRSVVKSAGDSVPSLPAEARGVERAAYTDLMSLLVAASADAAVMSRVQQCMDAVVAEAAAADSSAAAAPADGGEADGGKKALTFSAFRARMAKKKEEMQSTAASEVDAMTAASSVATAPPTANPSVNPSVAPSETVGGTSANASLGVSPAMQPATGATGTAAPPSLSLGKQADTASEGSRQGGAKPAPEAPKPMAVVLTAAPLTDDDLYAEFTQRGRGRGKSGSSSHNSSDPWRGGSAWRGRGGGDTGGNYRDQGGSNAGPGYNGNSGYNPTGGRGAGGYNPNQQDRYQPYGSQRGGFHPSAGGYAPRGGGGYAPRGGLPPPPPGQNFRPY